MSPKFLFILKYRENYNEFVTSSDGPSYSHLASGLLNSATFVVNMLRHAGVECKLIQAIDNNCIDKEVFQYKPTHVIVEAFWVVPEKFEILQKLHPNVQWIIRGHSEVPFIANEGIAIDWLCRYVKHENVAIATNSEKSLVDLRHLIHASNPNWSILEVNQKVLYMPNYYPTGKFVKGKQFDSDTLHIACLGAVRPLKNNLSQAIAAVRFANSECKKLKFYINGTRSEQGGDNNFKNIRAVFHHTPHELIELPWMPHDQLLEFLKTVDVSMNVSFTETFNIVAADSVVSGTALVTSPEVYWSSQFSQANPTSITDIVSKLETVTNPFFNKVIKYSNWKRLSNFSKQSKEHWLRWIHSL